MSVNPPLLSHVSLGTRDMRRAMEFYESVLATIGCGLVERIMAADDVRGEEARAEEGKERRPRDGEIASGANGEGVANDAGSQDAPDAESDRHAVTPVAVAFGKRYPEFWINLPLNGENASVGNGTHVAFVADDRASVDAFHAAALAAGARDGGAPGERPDYGARYYGCFVYDLDGHKIEATYRDDATRSSVRHR